MSETVPENVTQPYAVLVRQLHPNLSISLTAVSIIDSLIVYLFELIVQNSNSNRCNIMRDTVLSLFPGELAGLAVKIGTEAIYKTHPHQVFTPDVVQRRLGSEADSGGDTAPFIAAVLEFIAAEIIEQAGDDAIHFEETEITPRHIQIAMYSDVELDKLFDGVTRCASKG